MDNFSDKALKLILDAEGLDQPGKWPGGQSGITIGIGYDLGYGTVDQFESDWDPYLTTGQLDRLRGAVGLRGIKAKDRAPELADIHIKRADANQVFSDKTIPQTVLKTEQAFPGLTQLPLDAQGALVSLVYNRGTSMVGDRRREMRAVRSAVAAHDLQKIADEIRSMKRLWVGQGLDGLLARRDAEADLVESSIT